jgi:hypothetical protein
MTSAVKQFFALVAVTSTRDDSSVAAILERFTIQGLREVQRDLFEKDGIFFTLRRICLMTANKLATDHELDLEARVELTRAILDQLPETASRCSDGASTLQ